jgi:H+/Cl- antiporter ClcA
MILQAALFCLLYFFSLGVSAVATLTVQDHRHFLLNNVVGSAWVLWVDELIPLIILSAVYILFCLVTLMARYDKVTQLWQTPEPVVRHSNREEDPDDVEKLD